MPGRPRVYREVLLDATTDVEATDGFVLPPAPAGKRLARIEYLSCPGSQASLRPVSVLDATLGPEGVFADAWWTVECDGVPPRTFRAFGGAHSITQILVRYGFMNADASCVHLGKVRLRYEEAARAAPDECLRGVPRRLLEARGVPQFYPTSGVCWYAAMCWISFCNESVRRLICARMPTDLAELCERCLYSRESAQTLRNRLWHEWNIGDDVEDDPLNDGRNGFSEFATLCAKFKVPVVQYVETEGTLSLTSPAFARDRKNRRLKLVSPKCTDEPHLLVVRFQFGDHRKFPALRNFALPCGARYRLVGVYIGQSKCGHQIGAASPTGDWRDWGFGDADLHKDGIGPMYVRMPDDYSWKDWWEAWDRVIHVTRFGAGRSRTCNMSLHNPVDKDPSDRGRGDRPKHVGEMSADWVFINDACLASQAR